MNKIYKVMWSKVKGCYVVVSELAKSHGKDKSRSKTRGLQTGLALTAFVCAYMGMAAVQPAMAITYRQSVKSVDSNIVAGEDGIAKFSILLNPPTKEEAEAQGLNERYSVKPGTNVAGDTTMGNYSIVMGYGTNTNSDHVVLIGNAAQSSFLSDGTVGIGDGVVLSYAVNSLALGSKAEIANSHSAIVIGPSASASNKSDNTIVMGLNSKASAAADSIVMGSNAKTDSNESIVMGKSAYVESSQGTNFGNNSVVIGGESFFSDNPFGVGLNTGTGNDSGQGVAVGSRVVTTTQATALGNDVYALGRSSIAIGSDDITSYRDKISNYDYEHYFKTLYQHIDPTGIKYGYGTQQTNIPDWAPPGQTYNDVQTIYSPTLAQGDGAIAIGSRSLAFNPGSTALGTLAFALAQGATAVGTQTRSEGVGSIAIGSHTDVFADNSVGTGNNIQILNKGGMAYGFKGYAGGNNSIAIGSNVYSNVDMDLSAQINDSNNTPHNVFSTQENGGGLLTEGLTQTAKIAGSDGAMNSSPYFSKSGTGYIKTLENIITATKADTTAAVTPGSPAPQVSSVFLPVWQEKNGVAKVIQGIGGKDNAITLGSYSAALGNNAIALGHGAFALADNNFAIGSFSYANAQNAMAIGLTSRALATNSLALGVGTSAAQNANDSIAIGTGSVNYGSKSSLIGNGSTITEGTTSLLFGSGSAVAGSSNIAVGNAIHVTKRDGDTQKNLAIGNNVFITDGTVSSMALGTDSKIGNGETDNRNMGIANAIALGVGAQVTTTDGEDENGKNAIAIGNNAQATLFNSIALGTESRTDYTKAELSKSPWAMPGAIATPSANNIGVVSVGAKDHERRIVNVASGAEDTDAVNVAQLRMTTEQLLDEINRRGQDGQSSYMSVQREKGDSAAMYNRVHAVQNYSKYIGLKKQALVYQAREALNGETFNQEALKPLYDKVAEMEKANPNFKTVAKDLADLVVPSSGTTTYKDFRDKIYAAFDKDKVYDDEGKVVNEGIVKTLTNVDAATLLQQEKDSNYNNLGAAGADSLAFGYAAKTTEDSANAVAIGKNAKASAANAVALGANTTSAGESSVAIGNGAAANGASSVALGKGATATGENTVALGNGAVADVSNDAGLTFGGSYAALTGAVQTPTGGAVLSVGATSNTRRITNVAAGAADTDAVNVAQLRDLAANKLYLEDGSSQFTKGVSLGDTSSNAEHRLSLKITGASSSDAAIQTTVNSDKDGVVIDLTDAAKKDLANAGAGVNALKDAIGLPKDSSSDSPAAEAASNNVSGPAATDGLSKSPLITQMQAVRDGNAGLVVYTNNKGERLAKVGDKYYSTKGFKQAKDGKWYPEAQVQADGTTVKNATAHNFSSDTAVNNSDIRASLVNPDGTTTAPTPMANIASGLGLANVNGASSTAITGDAASKAIAGASKDGKGGLLAMKGADLTRGANLGDLQAVAQAGLSFTGNENGKSVQRALGTSLGIKGADTNTNVAQFSDANVMTTVDTDNNVLRINIAKTPNFEGVKLQSGDSGSKPVSITPGTDGHTVTLAGPQDPSNKNSTDVELKGLKNGGADNSAATVGQVKELIKEVKPASGSGAKGLTFNTNNVLQANNVANTTKQADGSTVTIQGATDAQYDGSKYSTDNLTTFVDTTTAETPVIRIAMKDTPKLKGVELNNGQPDAKTVSLTPDKDGNLALSNDNTPDKKVELTGLKDGDAPDSAVTKKALDGVKSTADDAKSDAEAAKTAAQKAKDGLDALNGAVGLPGAAGGDGAIGIAGKNGKTGPAAKDGLNGTALATQAQALRDGTAGIVVYTTKDGDRVAKVGDKYYKVDGLKQAKDGKWYPAGQVHEDGSVEKSAVAHSFADGDAVPAANIRASLVNPDGTTTAPTPLANIASGLGLDNVTGAQSTAITGDAASKAVAGASKDGKGGLLAMKGADLTRGANLGDLQAVAQAGLSFTGNENGKSVQRALGTSLGIKGANTNTDASQFSDANVMTTVDTANNALRINIAKTPQFEGVKLQAAGDGSKPVSITPDAAGHTVTLAGPADAGNKGSTDVELKGLKNGGADNSAATVGQVKELIKEVKPASGSGAKGLTFNTNNVAQANNVVNTTKQADGSTVTIQGATNAQYDGSKYSTDNLTTFVDTTTSTSPVIRIAMKDTPKLKGLELSNGEPEAKTVSLTPDKDGNLALSNDNAPDKKVVLTGLKDGDAPDSAVTKKALDGVKTTAEAAKSDAQAAKTAAQNAKDGLDALNGAVGLPGAAGGDGAIGIAGKNGETGPAGKDGLNGTALATQAQALRDGTAGNVVYTTKDGDRVSKVGDKYYKVDGLKQAKDGKWYPAEKVNKDGSLVKDATPHSFQDSEAVKPEDLRASLINPDGTTKTPTALGNVGSALELPGKYTPDQSSNTPANPAAITADAAQKAVAGNGKDGKDGLLTKSGTELNRATTLGDLQAVAQAGLDFTGNESNKTVHRPLGTSLAIKGDDGNTEAANFSAANIMTTVDTANNVLRINFAKTPQFEGMKLQAPGQSSKPISLTPSEAGDEITLAGGADGASGVVLKGLKESSDKTAAATVGQLDEKIAQLKKPTSSAPVSAAEGLTFKTNKTQGAESDQNLIKQADGSTVIIEGAKGSNFDSTTYSSDNLTVYADKSDTSNPVVRVAMKDTPKVKGLELNNGADQAKTVTVTPDKDGNVKLANGQSPDSNVVLSGLKDGDTDDSAVTKKALDGVKATAETAKNTADTAKGEAEAAKTAAQNAKDGLDALNSAVGLPGAAGQDGAIGIAGKNGKTGPAGKDGLNGTALATQAQALRDGTAGNVVYTTKNGDRVFKVGDNYYNVENLKQAKDGKWYPKDQVNDDGTTKPNAKAQDFTQLSPVATKDIIMSTVNPDGTATTPTTLGNVGSALELPGKYTEAESANSAANPATITADAAQKAVAGSGKDGKGGLLTQAGPALNRATTLGDLQAVAQAGLDFTGNEADKTVHRALGTSLAIKGDDGNTEAANFSAANIMTTVDTTNNVVRINFAKTPKFEAVKLQSPSDGSQPISITPDAAGHAVTLAGPQDPSNKNSTDVELKGLKKGSADNSAATVGQVKDLIKDIKPTSAGSTSAKGLTFDTNEVATADHVAKTTAQADGSTVTIQGAGTATYDASKYSTDNISTFVDTTTSESPVIRIAMKDTPKVKGLELNNGEAQAKTVTVTPDKDGNVKLSNGEGADNRVVLSGLKDGNTDDSAVTKKALDGVKATAETAKNTADTAKGEAESAKTVAQNAKDGLDALNSAVGLPGAAGGEGAIGIAGKNGATGPAGKDGLNGTALATQAQALRDGTAGNVVYTTKDGDRVSKVGDKYYKTDGLKQAKDGKWYPKDQVNDDGTTKPGAKAQDFDQLSPVATKDIIMSTVNPDGTAKTPTALGNVGSALELPGKYTDAQASNTVANPAAITADAAQKAIAGPSKDGNGGLLTKAGAGLNRATTLGDLQALAQAGLDFTGNEAGKTVHRALGTSLAIKGDDKNTDVANFSAANIMTTVDTDNNVLRINFAKTPQFEGVKLQAPGQTSKPISLTPNAAGDEIVLGGGATGKDNVVLRGLKPSEDRTAAATVGQLEDKISQINRPSGGTVSAAQGLTFKTNTTASAQSGQNLVKQADGSTVSIEGAANSNFDATTYSSDNLTVYADKTDTHNPVIRVAMKDTPKLKGLELNNGAQDAKTVTVTPDKDGNVKLSNGESPDNNVILTGLKDGTTDDSAVTKKALDGVKSTADTAKSTAETAKNTAETAKNTAESAKDGVDALKSAVGLPGADGGTGAIGIAGENGKTGPAGKDGLNGTALATQAQALRDGTAGNVVYTTKEGDRVFKVGDKYYKVDNLKQAKDGKWYPADKVKTDGSVESGATAHDFKNDQEVAPADIRASLVNPDGTATKPTALGNVGSALELPGTYASADASHNAANPAAITADAAEKAIAGESKDGNGGLLTKTGADLNRATTLGDLQAVAQAGLTFTSNEASKDIHRPLGTSLGIKGDDGNTEVAKFSATNIMTTLDTTNNVVRINFAKTPQFEGVKLQASGQDSKPISITPDATGHAVTLAGPADAGNQGKTDVELKGLKNGSADNSAATVGQVKDLIKDLRPTSTATPAKGLTFNTNTVKEGDGLSTVKQVDGSTVTIQGSGTAQYDASKYSTDNISTYVDNSKADSPVIRIAMKDTPEVKGLALNNGADQAKTVTVTPDKDGNVALSNGASPENKVVLSGLKDGTTDDSAVTKKALDGVKSTAETAKSTAETAKNMAESAKNGLDALNSAVGLPGADGGPGAIGIAGENGKTGPAGKDGLNGTALATQAQALRDGTAGNVVYTTKEGDRVFKVGDKYYKTDGLKQAKDGKWYPAEKVQTDGSVAPGAVAHDFASDHEVAPADIRASLINPDGTAKSPTALGNVASALELPGKYTEDQSSNTPANPAAITADAAQKAVAGNGKDGNGGLLTKAGADLNRATTLGDLQAVAQAGLDFTGNESNKTVHRPLGTSLAIKGDDANTDADKFSASNIMTTVDTDNNVVRINFAKTPQFDAVKLGADNKAISLTPSAAGDKITLAGPAGTDGKTDVVLSGLKGDSTDLSSAVTYGQLKTALENLRPSDDQEAAARDLAALKDAVGLPKTSGESGAIGEAAKNGATGPAGKDGLNGTALASQAQALRDGTAGNVVYTTKEGDRVFKVGDKYYKVNDLKQAKDGKWYPADKVKADGSVESGTPAHDFTNDTEVKAGDIRATLINADGTTTAPTTLGNVASALDLPGKYADSQATNSPANPAAITSDAAQKAIAGDAKDGNGGLLTKSGADLNRATTLGDLQAVAQAGLTFTSNEANKDIHRPLGTSLGIKGDDANVDASKFSAANVMTTVDAINNVIRVNIAKAPVFDSVQFGTAGPSLVVNKEGKLSIKQGDQVAPIATEASTGFYVNTDHGKFFLGMGDTLNLSNLGDSNVTVSAVKDGESTPTSGSTTGAPSESTPKTESAGNVPAVGSPTAAQGGGNPGNVPSAAIPAAGQGGGTTGTVLSPAGQGGGTTSTALSPVAQGNSYKVGVQMNPDPVYNSVSVTGKLTSDNNLVPKKYVDEQLGKVVNQANSIINNLGEQMRDTRNQASAGTASAMAAAGLPTVINADSRHVVSIGFGSYDNQTAMAVGMSGTNRKRDRIYKVTGTVDSAGKYGVSAGLSFAVGGKDHYRPGRNTYDAGFNERLDRLEAEAKKVDTQAKTIDKLTKENADLKSEVETLKQLVYKQLNMKAQEQQTPKKDQDNHTSESTDSTSK